MSLDKQTSRGKQYDLEKIKFDKRIAWWYGFIIGLFIGFSVGLHL